MSPYFTGGWSWTKGSHQMLMHISACVLERKPFERKWSLLGQAVGGESKVWNVEMKDKNTDRYCRRAGRRLWERVGMSVTSIRVRQKCNRSCPNECTTTGSYRGNRIQDAEKCLETRFLDPQWKQRSREILHHSQDTLWAELQRTWYLSPHGT